MKISKRMLQEVQSYVIISLGLFIMALGWTAFLIPSQIIGGGVSGISTLIYFATDFPVGLSILIINAFLVIIAIRILGASFGIKTIFSILIFSAFMAILQYYIHEPFVKERFMAAIIGGMMSGASIGLIFTQGGSTGGTDIIAMIINKYRNISPGRIILATDLVIISSSYLIFQSIETMVYGYVVMAVSSYSIDMILTGSKQSVQLFIFSKHAPEISNRIANEIGRGVTLIKGIGWYTKTENDIIMVIARKIEMSSIFKIVKQVDPDAFISLNTVMGVYGKGFDTIRKTDK